MAVKKICCLVLGHAGVPIAVAIAANCPGIKVTVVHSNAERIFLWNAKQIPALSRGLGDADFIRKCHNKNLFFTTNTDASIKEADLIFIVSKSTLKSCGDGKDEVVDLTQIQEVAYLIAGHAESNKIIVEASDLPYKNSDCIKEILNNNCRPQVNFQVLANPNFYDEGPSFCNILSPECVLIGSDDTVAAAGAVKELSAIYERWIEPCKILTGSTWTVELGKLCSRAMAAQRLANLLALASMCERLDANAIGVLGSVDGYLPMSFNPSRSPELRGVLSTFAYLARSVKLQQLSEFWGAAADVISRHSTRFVSRLKCVLNGSLANRKIVLFGFAGEKETSTAQGSVTIDISKLLIEKGAQIRIFDSKVSQSEVVEALVAAGCLNSKEDLENLVAVHEDSHQAVLDCEGLIVCVDRPEFVNIDFPRVFNAMLKPAYLFDYGNLLVHNDLLKIGFRVFGTGMCIEN